MGNVFEKWNLETFQELLRLDRKRAYEYRLKMLGTPLPDNIDEAINIAPVKEPKESNLTPAQEKKLVKRIGILWEINYTHPDNEALLWMTEKGFKEWVASIKKAQETAQSQTEEDEKNSDANVHNNALEPEDKELKWAEDDLDI